MPLLRVILTTPTTPGRRFAFHPGDHTGQSHAGTAVATQFLTGTIRKQRGPGSLGPAPGDPKLPRSKALLTTMTTSLRYTYDRPYRSLGVRLFNGIGGVVRRLGWERPLTMDRVLDAARRKTGLENFGRDDFREPLALLCDEFQNTAQLHPFGHYCMRKLLQSHAENRLKLEAAWQRHPEYLQQPLVRPLYVIGMPRTGTTLLYNLLCQDPNARPLMVWETLYPAPTEREERRGDNRYRQWKASVMVKAMNRLAPNLKQVHAIEPDGPEECGWLMNNTFVSLMFLLDGALPRYFRYFMDLPHERMLAVYDYYMRQLQLLQAGQTNRHWVLKSPVHQGTMAPLLETIPTAHVIHTHRDPMKVIPSLCSLVCMTRGIFTDRQDNAHVGPELAERMVNAVEKGAAAEEAYGDRITNVLFDTLVKDPIGTVRNVYERFGYKYTDEMEAGMKRWLDNNPQGKHGAHKYELEQFGLTTADIQRIFGAYWNDVQKRAA